MTKSLNDVWKQHGPKGKNDPVTVEQLRQIYNDAYKDYPHWLEIIEKQLR